MTLITAALLAIIIGGQGWHWWHAVHRHEFSVDTTSPAVAEANKLQLQLDITVQMPCKYVSIDVRDSAGDSLHLRDLFDMQPAPSVGSMNSASAAPKARGNDPNNIR